MTISAAQVKAARALLGWSQTALAGRADLSNSAISFFENGRRRPSPRGLLSLRKAFEAAGVEFTAGEAGVRTRGSAVSISGEQVKEARGLLGWSQSKLAKQVGLTKTVLRHIENGVGRAPVLSLSVVRKTFEAAGVEFTSEAGVRLRKAL
jgi:transcriptional regulator with XRE-family HTH domain